MISKEKVVRKAVERAVPLSIYLWAGGGGQNTFGKVGNVTGLQ